MSERLRRADWRFLLPPSTGKRYRRLVVLGAGRALADHLEANGFADQVSTQLHDAPEADAIVVMAAARVRWPALLAQLSGAAVIYCEIDRRYPRHWALTPRRFGRLLSRGGLQPQAWYWAIPSFDAARRHIPLEGAALRWYLTTLHTAGTPHARAAERMIRLFAGHGPGGLAPWVPCYSVVATAASAPGAAAGALSDGATQLAMLTSGVDDGSRVVLLPFAAGEETPSRVVKLARLRAFDEHTEREQRTLSELRARLSPAFRASLPTPLGPVHWDGVAGAAESYAPGTPIGVTSGRYGAPFEIARDDLRHAVAWLIEFHRQTRRPASDWSSVWTARVLDRLDACARLFPARSSGPALLALARASAREAGGSLPLVRVHNDLGPWNIHRNGSDITVIDWELGEGADRDRLGPAGCDLFYLVTYWFFRARRLRGVRAEARGVRELFGHTGSRGRAVPAAREEIQRYAGALGIDPRSLPLLLVLTWAERALEREERNRLDGRLPTQAPNPYTRFLEILAPRGAAWFTQRRWP